jgi:hypothetical protein
MDKVNLQQKTSAREGTLSFYWLENPRENLPLTKFYRVQIPLAPFDSGLEWDLQPTETKLEIDGIVLAADDDTELDGLSISSASQPELEASIYLGAVHNPCDVEALTLTRRSEERFRLRARLLVDFEYEGVTENEIFELETDVRYLGEDA